MNLRVGDTASNTVAIAADAKKDDKIDWRFAFPLFESDGVIHVFETIYRILVHKSIITSPFLDKKIAIFPQSGGLQCEGKNNRKMVGS